MNVVYVPWSNEQLIQLFIYISAWVSHWNFSALSWHEKATFLNGDDVWFVRDQQSELDFYSASSLKQQFTGWNVTSLWLIILTLSQPVFDLTP